MSTRTKESLQRQIDRLQDRLAEVEAFGEDVYENDTVIFFKFRYARESGTYKTYTFVAVKIKGYWYLSGDKYIAQPTSWSSLVEFWAAGKVVEMWVASEWSQVVI